MNEIQVHDATQQVEKAFTTIDQDSNQLISKVELSDYIAKHPADVDTVTAAKFMLDHFQVISNLETNDTADGVTPLVGQGISQADLHALDLLTAADGNGVSNLASEDAWKAVGTPAIIGGFGALTLSVGGVATETLGAAALALPPLAFIAGSVVVGAVVAGGIAYEVDKYRSTKEYTQKQTEVAALYQQ